VGFWESFKAAFLGGAGVDYYAKKTRDEVAGLRADLRRPQANPWSDADAVQAAFAELHAGIVELQAAFTDTGADANAWSARISLAFADVIDVLDGLQASFPIPASPDPDSVALVRHYRRTVNALRRSGDLWLQDNNASGDLFGQAKTEWAALMDEVDRLAG
jgi:hypothetical protein